LLTVTLEGFLTAKDKSDFLTVISDGLRILAGIDRFIYFLLDTKRRVLFGYVKNVDGRYAKTPNLAVPMSLEQSLLVKSILGKTPLNYFRDAAQSSLPIIDEQVIDLLGGQGIYCLPIAAQGDSVGVLVLSIRKNDLPHLLRSEKLLKILIHKGALALQLDHLRQRQLNEVQFKRADASSDLARRVVHEVNNPLGIIKNYLKILEIKLSNGKMALDEIRIINEEISRVADVLKKLTDISQEKPLTQSLTDVNALLADIVKITKNSLLEHSDIKLVTNFSRALPRVRADKAGLKQVMVNLIKNAVEAMTSGGNLYLKTRHFSVPADSKRAIEKKDAAGYVEIQVIDEGPGMPDSIKEKLFDPYVSTKKGEHFGLGLSIAYNIVRSFQGSLTCESIPGKGTVFRIELPVRSNS
jgi:nitrogen-specific signal transduction histidine kinase